ncbi:MAG: phosphotransferase [Pseudomonadota bacterium]
MTLTTAIERFDEVVGERHFRRQLAEFCAVNWGIVADIDTLGAEKDLIFAVRCCETDSDYVLRLSHPERSQAELELQTAAMAHVYRKRGAGFFPRPIPGADGTYISSFAVSGDLHLRSTLSTWVKGTLLIATQRTEAQAQNVGVAIGALSEALSDFDHPASRHAMDWDIARCGEVLALTPAIEDASTRRLVEAAVERFVGKTAPLLAEAEHQVIHADATPYNVLVSETNTDRVTGIIDFGDTVYSARVCDVGVGASYLMERRQNALRMPAALVRGFETVCPLSVLERQLLVPLMEARHAMTVAITTEHAQRRPANSAAITKNTLTAIEGLKALSRKSHAEWTADLLSQI